MTPQAQTALFKKATICLYCVTGLLTFMIITEIVRNHIGKEKEPPKEAWYKISAENK